MSCLSTLDLCQHPLENERTDSLKPGVFCHFEELNDFRYHDNWFRNLMIASSLNGRRPHIQS